MGRILNRAHAGTCSWNRCFSSTSECILRLIRFTNKSLGRNGWQENDCITELEQYNKTRVYPNVLEFKLLYADSGMTGIISFGLQSRKTMKRMIYHVHMEDIQQAFYKKHKVFLSSLLIRSKFDSVELRVQIFLQKMGIYCVHWVAESENTFLFIILTLKISAGIKVLF